MKKKESTSGEADKEKPSSGDDLYTTPDHLKVKQHLSSLPPNCYFYLS
jgi:hypothetical protein